MEKMNATTQNSGLECQHGSGSITVPCPYCGKPLKREYIVLLGNSIFGPLETCDCPEGKSEAERAVKTKKAWRDEQMRRELDIRRRSSGMLINQLRQTFATFKVDASNREAFNAAKEFVEKFKARRPDDLLYDEEPMNLMFLGKAGVGKTHLAAAIANRLIDAGNYITFRTVPELLSELKSTFGREGDDEYELMWKLKRTVLLILDDLGKEQQTEWSLAKMYEIINNRYENRMPIIVTSNYSPAELYERFIVGGDKNTAMAILSRLGGMCKTVGILGKDRRINVH